MTVRGAYRGCVECPERSGAIRLGLREGSFNYHKGISSLVDFHKRGKLVVTDSAEFVRDFHLNLNGVMTVGKSFWSNAGLLVSCGSSISFGEVCLLGWNVTLIDGDGHQVYVDGKASSQTKPIVIGNHCWLCAGVTVLKGVRLADVTIVPMQSVITKSCNVPNCIYGSQGIIRENVNWER